MSDPVEDRHSGDLLERAIRALRDVEVPAALPRSVVDATMRTLTSSPVLPEELRRRQRRALMVRSLSYAGAGVLVVATLAVAVFWPSHKSFAAVVRKMREADSVSLVCKQRFGQQPEMEFHWFVRGEQLRMELPGLMAQIGDLGAKRGIELDMQRKTARPLDFAAGVAAAFTNPVEQLCRVAVQDSRWAREESWDGKVVDVYELTHVNLLGIVGTPGSGESVTVFVDRASSLPLRISIDVSFEVSGQSRDHVQFERFEWDANLDDALFSLEVPEGYTRIELDRR